MLASPSSVPSTTAFFFKIAMATKDNIWKGLSRGICYNENRYNQYSHPIAPDSSNEYSILVEKLSMGVIDIFPSAFIVPPNDLPENVILLYCSTFESVKAKLVPSFCSNRQVVVFSHGPDILVTLLIL